jgi:hypothetical protein
MMPLNLNDAESVSVVQAKKKVVYATVEDVPAQIDKVVGFFSLDKKLKWLPEH